MRRIVLLLAAAVSVLLGGCCRCGGSGGVGKDAGEMLISRSAESKTPSGVRIFGPFGNESFWVGFPRMDRDWGSKHDFLEISMDLVIIRTWDGSVEIGAGDEPTATGPDYWSLRVTGYGAGGPMLLYTTFSNLEPEVFDEASRFQNYPSPVPGDRLLATSGAAAKNSFGYEFTRASTNVTYKMDTTYHLHFIIPHKGPTVAFELRGMNLQELEDESWGFRNINVRTLKSKDVERPNEAAIEKAFAEGLDAKGLKGAEAFSTLAVGMEGTVAWIQKNVAPMPVNAAAAAPLVAKLASGTDDPGNATRVKLLEVGPQVEVLLRDAYEGTKEAGRAMLDGALQVIGVTPIEDAGLRRVMLATRALEVIGTPEALALRKKLAVN